MGRIALFAIGGSAGGLDALRHVISRLPREFPAAICVVLHISPDSPGLIPDILTASGALPACNACDGEELEPGRIYVAPPDRHLLVTSERRTLLGRGPKENLFRPAIDPLFRSAAVAFRQRAAGVVLSGGLDDGAAGLAAIKRAGGVAIVQDPNDALVPSMPRAAMRSVDIDDKVRTHHIADRMVVWTQAPIPAAEPEMVKQSDAETRIAAGEDAGDIAVVGKPSLLTCPDCGGVMRQLPGSPLRYRCHTGHAYTSDTFAAALKQTADDALWKALRVLRERELLARAKAESGENTQSLADHEIALIERTADGLRALIDKDAGNRGGADKASENAE